MRIRMKDSETGRFPDGRTYHVRADHEYDVPGDVPETLARVWIDIGLAERLSRENGLPDGYAIDQHPGGYYRLFGPDGEVIEGPSNGKYQGKDAALEAAEHHQQHSEE